MSAADSSASAQAAGDQASADEPFAEVLRGRQAAGPKDPAKPDTAAPKPDDVTASATAGEEPPMLSPEIAAALAQLQHATAPRTRGAEDTRRAGPPIDADVCLRPAAPRTGPVESRPAPGTPTRPDSASAGEPSAAPALGMRADTDLPSAGARAPRAESATSLLSLATAGSAESAQARAQTTLAGALPVDTAAPSGAAEAGAARVDDPLWTNFAVPIDTTATRQAAAVHHTPTIEAPVGSPRFTDEAAQQVTWMARNGIGEAEIRVKPAELGPISVRIEMNHNEAIINFAVTQPETRAAVEDALHRLQEMLAESGISLGEANVGGQGFMQRSRDHGGTTRSRVTFPAGNRSGTLETLASPARLFAQPGRGVVDIFA